METETTWIDAWIRWDRNSKDIIVDDDEEDQERVPPTKEFFFDYKLHDSNLTLALKGFPSESEQIWNSTGLTLWPSSHYLCEYLLEHHHQLLPAADTSTIRVVELGSGLGRCGLLLHHLLTRTNHIQSHIYMTDGDTDTLAQLRDNVMDNTDSHQDSSHKVSCHQLLWGEEPTSAFCKHHFDNNHDEKKEDHHNSVDLVLGSDLVYSPRVIGPLFETVSMLLTNDDSEPKQFLMAHSDRREGSSVTLKMVLEGAQTAGLAYEILQTIEREGIYIIAFRLQ